MTFKNLIKFVAALVILYGVMVFWKNRVEKNDQPIQPISQQTSFTNVAGEREWDKAGASYLPMFHQMCEYMLLISRDKSSLEKGVGDMDNRKKSEIRNWFENLSTENFPNSAGADIRKYRSYVMNYLNSTSMSGYERGYAQAEQSQEFVPILIDLEINGDVLTRQGRPDLAKPIDALLSLNKLILMHNAGVDEDELEEARPSTRLCLEYLAIFIKLFKASERPVIAQAALLITKPEKLPIQTRTKALENLYGSLMNLSRSINNSDSELGTCEARALVDLISVIKKCEITNTEATKAGGAKLAGVLKQIREM